MCLYFQSQTPGMIMRTYPDHHYYWNGTLAFCIIDQINGRLPTMHWLSSQTLLEIEIDQLARKHVVFPGSPKI